jgi:1A family penicillin-binding protein
VTRTKRKKTNETLAPKIAEKSLGLFGKVLVLIGKPFYLILSYLIISLLLLVSSVGELTTLVIKTLFKLLTKFFFIFSFIFSQAKKVSVSPVIPVFNLPKISKIKTPRISIPQIRKKYIVLFFAICLTTFSFWFFILKNLPSPKDLVTRDIEVSTKIYDRNGILLYQIYKDKNRSIVPLEDIPQTVRLATLAAEDAGFYSHPGFSVKGITRAIYKNLTEGKLSGGSTITQQLVKNALLSSEKTYIRKLREIVLAVEVEATFSKDEILDMYLNEVSYGGTAYGIEEASRVYFNKDVSQLTLGEAALLAGLPKSPSKYSPFGPNPDLSIQRQKEVLKLMKENGFISQDQENTALKEKLTFAPNKTDIKAPHFVMYVREKLAEKYGEEVVEKGGLNVVTTLDYSIQKLAEEAVKSELDKLKGLNVTNGAAVVLNPKTGEILAMVGSKDYFDTKNDGNVNVTTSLRQPGSSIKLINYAYALSHGYTPATILSDTPVTFSIPGQKPYSPKDYDGKYRGLISLRSAFAESRNIPAVKVLASYGVGKMVEMGKKMGITTWDDPSQYGLSLTLGGGAVKLTDLADAYATVANYGKKPDLTSILKVTNYRGKVLDENNCISYKSPLEKVSAYLKIKQEAQASTAQKNCNEEQIISPGVSYLLINILKDNIARSPAFGLNSMLVINNHPEVAVKTGTSNDLRDNLTVGFNQNYLVATWVGNNDNSPMSRVASGVTGASPIWNRIMTSLLYQKKSVAWQVPDGVENLSICSITGTLPCQGCPTKDEWFLTNNKPTSACKPSDLAKKSEAKDGGKILDTGAQTQATN